MTLAGTPVVVEGPVPPRPQRLKLRIEQLSETDAETLRNILNASGTLTVHTETGGTSYTCAWSDEDQVLEEIFGAYPDGTVPSQITKWRAELSLVVLSTS